MKKYAGLIAIFMIILIGGILFVGCKDKKLSSDYFPLGVGSYWEYNVLSYVKGGITKMTKDIVKVVGKEKVGEIETYVIDRYVIEGNSPSIGQYREYLKKTDKGVECVKRAFPLLMQARQIYPTLQSDIINTPAEPRFKNNLKDGDTWKWEGIVTLVPIRQGSPTRTRDGRRTIPQKPPIIEKIKGTMEYKYLGHETIHEMGKDYDCIKISVFGKSEMPKGSPREELESICWYAQGIGKIREEQKFFKGSEQVSNLFELVSYNITNREPFKKK